MSQDTPPISQPAHPPAQPQATLHESRTAQNSATFLLPILDSMLKSNPHLSLLDVGSGSGTISVSFAQLIPLGHVMGLDINANILPRAQAFAEKAGVGNVEFKEGSVFELPFRDESFDVVWCHQVLIHVGNPWDALREMLRVTKRGGIVAAREGDYESECIWPELPKMKEFHKLMVGHMSAGGGTPTAGRQLLSWALKAGVERGKVECSFSTSSYSTASERKSCSEGLCSQLRGGARLREKALKLGLSTENELEEIAKAWEEWAERDDASLAMLHGEILVQK